MTNFFTRQYTRFQDWPWDSRYEYFLFLLTLKNYKKTLKLSKIIKVWKVHEKILIHNMFACFSYVSNIDMIQNEKVNL